MKYIKILSILLLSTVTTFYACNDKSDARKQDASDAIEVTDMQTPPSATTPEPAQNAEGIWHYTCEKGCAGGAGAAGTCATCGGALAHNSAYHGNNNTMPTINPLPTNAMGAQATPPAEPAQNAAGVWHYTCAKGCAGGAGAAGTCASCGGPLAHNQGYHQ